MHPAASVQRQSIDSDSAVFFILLTLSLDQRQNALDGSNSPDFFAAISTCMLVSSPAPPQPLLQQPSA
jgi:hypothetical protein